MSFPQHLDSMNFRISVIIPTIGRPALINALNSVYDQTLKPFEIIIIDDSELQNLQIPAVKLVKTGGLQGVSKSRNLGIDNATGNLLAFLDDDDIWLSNHLESQVNFLSEKNLDFVISSALVNDIKRPSETLKVGVNPFEILYGKKHFLRSRTYLPTSGYICKKDSLFPIHFDETLIDRENLKFLNDFFLRNARVGQSRIASVNINYNSRNSLGRIDVQQEIKWFRYLRTFNQDYATNFKFESIRNFMRKGRFFLLLKFLIEK